MLIYKLIINKLLLPECMIVTLILGILGVDGFLKDRCKEIIYSMIQIGLLFTIYRIYLNFNEINNYVSAVNSYFFKNGFMLNFENNCLKLVLVTLMYGLLVFTKNHITHKHENYTAYLVLHLLLLLGVMIIVSSNGFFNFYLGLEMTSVAIYGLIASSNQYASLRNAFNYFVISMIFSGLLLYGLSLIYGATGSLTFSKILDFVTTQHISGLFNVGMMLVLIAIFFKLHLFPWQIWLPNISQTCSLKIILLLAILPQIAIVGVYSYVLKHILNNYLNFYVQSLLIILALVNVVIGNLGIISQIKIKQFLAYSVIANSGVVLLGLFSNNPEGIWAANVYVVIHGMIMLTFMGIILLLQRQGMVLEEIHDFNGLYKEHPAYSLLLLILLLAFSGFPPTAGFYMKFLIFKALIAVKFTWVALIAGLSSLLSMWYYFKIISLICFGSPNDSLDPTPITRSPKSIDVAIKTKDYSNYAATLLAWFNVGLILFAGFLPLLGK